MYSNYKFHIKVRKKNIDIIQKLLISQGYYWMSDYDKKGEIISLDRDVLITIDIENRISYGPYDIFDYDKYVSGKFYTDSKYLRKYKLLRLIDKYIKD